MLSKSLSGSGGSCHTYYVSKVMVPVFLPFLLTNSTSLNFWTSAFLMRSAYLIGFDPPRNSSTAPSSSKVWSSKLPPFLISFSTLTNSNSSFQTGVLPPSSITSVLYVLPAHGILTNGSYLPKVSASFKNVAETTLSLIMQFGLSAFAI